MEQMTLDELQKCCLGVLRAFDTFCEKQGLRYFLIGGSALGAVRHKGFIPWDDDVDVGMMREDYETFLRSYRDNDAYELVCLGKTEGYFSPAAKFCDKNTVFMEPTSANVVSGVFIDVFPLDYVCASSIQIKKTLFQEHLYRHAFTVNLQARQFREESIFKRLVRGAASRWYATSNPISVSDKITSRIASSSPTSQVMNIWGAWGERELCPAEWFGNGEMVSFCDMVCRIPAEWDKYLTRLYGDYMVPSPKFMHSHGAAYSTG